MDDETKTDIILAILIIAMGVAFWICLTTPAKPLGVV